MLAVPGAIASRRVLLLVVIWLLAGIACLPFLFRWHAPPPATGNAGLLRIVAGYAFALAVCCLIYAAEFRRLGRRQALVLVFLVLLLTKITNRVHQYTVDYGRFGFPNVENTDWQIMLEDNIIQRDRFDAAHAARFLPNSVVRWLQLGGWSFPQARDLYRLLFEMLLFYSIYRYARIFTGHTGAIIAVLLTAAVFPISFQYYVGQLTDPLSHLSFVLAFVFIEREDYAFLLTTLVIGALAKESVLALAGYYVLFGRKDKRYPIKAGALLVCCAAVYFGVRVMLLDRAMGYKDISGVTPRHLIQNLTDSRWPYVFVLTAGSLVPILAIGWKQTPSSLRRLAVYLMAVLFVSSAFFSWLVETRNFMPVVIVLAVAAGYLLTTWAGTTAGQPAPLMATASGTVQSGKPISRHPGRRR